MKPLLWVSPHYSYFLDVETEACHPQKQITYKLCYWGPQVLRLQKSPSQPAVRTIVLMYAPLGIQFQ